MQAKTKMETGEVLNIANPRDESATEVVNAAASVRALSKSFRGATVLGDINFDVKEGESLVLLGASGSGKTTILRIIAGLEQPDTGRVILHGRDVTDLPARERGVGVIFQDYALFPRMTIEDNIAYGLRLRGRSRSEIKETVNRLLTLVRLEEHRKKRPAQLSGGQQQRVSIARTLAYKPEVLLFDEPFGALDAGTRVRLRREIRTILKQVNVPAIFITHDQEEAIELGDRIAVLNFGHLEQIGTPEEIYRTPATEFVATFLGAANLLPGIIKGGAIELPTLGDVRIFASEAAARFKENQAVKLIFRPEDMAITVGDTLPQHARPLCEAVVEEITFVGAYERIALRLKDALVNATRPTPEASALRLHAGDRVNIGLVSFHLLPASS